MFHVSSFKFYALTAVIGVLPLIADAQALILQSQKSSYQVGDSFQVSLFLDTHGKSINTLEGTVDIPIRAFQILDARYGNSIISLWVEKPKVDYANGYISFTGGVPGGFKGEAGPILSFGLKAKKAANATVKLKDMKALLNDGLGTEVKDLTLNPITLRIVEAPIQPPRLEEKKEEVYEPPPDTVPPEPFIPIVSRHPSISNNAYFVSFFAVDKDIGISHYEISERPLVLRRLTAKFDEPWVRGESPNVLRIQWWPTKVMVRAYDQAGNSIEAEAIKPVHPALMAILIVIVTLLALGILYLYKIQFTKKH